MRKIVQPLLLALAIALPLAVSAAPAPGSLVKASGASIYYYAYDGKRYVFPNQKTYLSWYNDFSRVAKITDAELAAMPLGGNVTYRPGIRMIKVQSDPKVYAVAPGGVLRWVKTEEVARALYGQYWNTAIDDLSDAFFASYRVGEPLDNAADFTAKKEDQVVDTIDADKGIPLSPPTPVHSDTEVDSLLDSWRSFALADLNNIRRNDGKPPLIMNPIMNRTASIHSKDMALNLKDLSHDGSLGETAHERIRDGKVPDVTNHVFMTVPHPDDIDWSAENVGYTTRHNGASVEDSLIKIHQLFLNEPPDQPNHRTTMLSTFHPYSEVGIGPYVDAQGTLWLTEDYISHP